MVVAKDHSLVDLNDQSGLILMIKVVLMLNGDDHIDTVDYDNHTGDCS